MIEEDVDDEEEEIVQELSMKVMWTMTKSSLARLRNF